MSVSSAQPEAAEVLRQNSFTALRNLQVEEGDDEIVVSGSVSSYYLKQLAQEALMPLAAGRRLCNRVLVVRP